MHPSVDSDAVKPFPNEGMKLSELDLFISECGGRSVLEGLSTYDVNFHVKLLTNCTKSSYCDYLKTRSPNSVGEAQVFISHAWKYKFLDVVDTLRYHFRDTPDVIIWFDLFSNNQHKTDNLDFFWWSTTFKSAIEKFNHTTLILSPWNHPIALTRAWCLFEIYCTVACSCKFEIAMSPSEQKNFLEAMKLDCWGYMNTMLATIDTRKSEATKSDDKTRIFDAVESTVGFDGINKLVFDRLRRWVIDTASTAIQMSPNEEDRATAQHSLGLLHMNQGRYKLAGPLLQDSLNVREKLLGNTHNDTLESMNSLAGFYKESGNYGKAKGLYEKCLHTREDAFGIKHRDTLQSMNNLALLLVSMEQYDEAFKYHTKCIDMRNEVLGEKDRDTLQSMNNLAQLFSCRKEYSIAFDYHTKCLDLRKEVLGEQHRNTLQSMNNLALLLKNMGRYKEALGYHSECLKLRLDVLGERDRDTLQSINNLALLLVSLERCDEAFKYHRKCLDLRKEVLGEQHRNTLQSMNNLALLLEKMGRYDEAVNIHSECLKLRNEVLGEQHRDSLQSISNLAMLREKMGRNEGVWVITQNA